MNLLKCTVLSVILLNSAFNNLLVNCTGCEGTASVILLTQRWSTTACYNEGWNSNPECAKGGRWTIHGLWPDKVKVTKPEDLSPKFLTDLANKPAMKRNWPFFGPADQNSYLGKEKDFWNHEWRKHGYCAKDFIKEFDEKTYFETALRLYENNNLFNALRERGIIPSNTVQYERYQIEETFGYGNAFIVCKIVNKRHYLAEISICMDQNLHVVSCESAHSPGNSGAYAPCNSRDTFLYPE